MEEDHVEEEEEEEDDDDTVMDVAVRMLKKNVALQCMHLDLLFMAIFYSSSSSVESWPAVSEYVSLFGRRADGFIDTWLKLDWFEQQEKTKGKVR